jgi:hypothetical protein
MKFFSTLFMTFGGYLSIVFGRLRYSALSASERLQLNRNLSSPQVKAIGHQSLKTPETFFES